MHSHDSYKRCHRPKPRALHGRYLFLYIESLRSHLAWIAAGITADWSTATLCHADRQLPPTPPSEVRFLKTLSRCFSPKAKVPQGSVLAPLLFCIYMVSIPQPKVPTTVLQQYADNSTAWIATLTAEAAANHLRLYLQRIRPNPNITQHIC